MSRAAVAVIYVAFTAAAEPMPRFEIHTRGGPVRVGEIQRYGDNTLRVGGESIPPLEFVSARRVASAIPGRPAGPFIELVGGDCIAGKLAGMDDAGVRFEARLLSALNDPRPLKVPLTAASRVYLKDADVRRDRHPAFFQERRDKDVLLLANGDTSLGTLLGVATGSGNLEWEADGKRETIPAANASAIAFNTRIARLRRPKELYFHTVLRDGSRLDLVDVSIERGRMQGSTTFREQVQFSLDDVATIDVRQGCAVYLSDLKPAEYSYRPYGSETFDWAADRSVSGGPLRLKTPIGVDTYDKGLALHGECRITYRFDEAYRRFESTVGLDPSLGVRGSVEVLIFVDGEEKPRQRVAALTLANGPAQIEVDLKKCRELTLVVKWGDGGNVGDYVNWGDARLIKE